MVKRRAVSRPRFDWNEEEECSPMDRQRKGLSSHLLPKSQPHKMFLPWRKRGIRGDRRSLNPGETRGQAVYMPGREPVPDPQVSGGRGFGWWSFGDCCGVPTAALG